MTKTLRQVTSGLKLPHLVLLRKWPEVSSLHECHLGLIYLLGCPESSQGGACPGHLRAHSLCKAHLCHSEQGLLDLLGNFMFQLSKGHSLQACSPGGRQELGPAVGAGGSSETQLQVMAPNLCLCKYELFFPFVAYVSF